jgi:hypothetical protein
LSKRFRFFKVNSVNKVYLFAAHTGHRGRELSKMSFLGPFLAMGVCDIEGENNFYAGADRYFDTEHIPHEETRFKAYDVYQGRMNNYRVSIAVTLFTSTTVNHFLAFNA